MIRLFHLGAYAALALVGLFASTSSTVRAAEPDKLLPADTDTVAVINIRQILDSEIIKKYALEQLKQTLDGQEAKKFLGELGLDPLKDIDKAIFASSGNSRADMKYLLVIRGKFDAEKLYKAAEAQSKKDGEKFAMIKDGNTVMFKYQPENGDPPVYGTVVDDRTVIAASDKKMISTALKASESGSKSAIKEDLTTLVKKMDDKASVSVASILKGKLDEVQLPMGGSLPIDLSGIQKVLPKSQSVILALRIGADINLEVTVGMKDDDAAADMRDAIDKLFKDLKPLAKLAGAAEPRAKPLAEILDSVKTSAKSKDVTIVGKVTGGNIGKMINPKDGSD